MSSEQDELRRGSAAAGERLPRLEQCAQQHEDYEREERKLLEEPRHISGLIEMVMARIQF